MCKYFLFTFLFSNLILSQCDLLAQADSTDSQPITQQDKDDKARRRRLNKGPRKALILSAIAPGLGQIYNKKYWKPPIIWAGLGVAGYFYLMNASYYRSYYSAYKTAFENPNTPFIPRKMPDGQNIYTVDQLNEGADQFRKYRDMSMIIGAAIYVLNIVDANVDAHLKEFDIGDELTLRVSPLLYANLNHQFTSGITLNFRFK
jgi:hypothetical protein